MRLAVLGDPLRYTRSPELHRAGLVALGRTCESRAIRTPPDRLEVQLRELAEHGYRGVNLTHPLKGVALECVPRVSARARRARSINTVGFESGAWWGETTDGVGFTDLLDALERTARGQDVLLLGAGGAARSVALALAESGAGSISVAARDPDRAMLEWTDIEGALLLGWQSAEVEHAFARASLIVNAAPIEADAMPVALDRSRQDALLIDLRYDRELMPWVAQARALGRVAHDGLGLLAHQARRSLQLWTGEDVAIGPLAEAIGWPR